jgi:hypothetical protein
VAGAPHGIFDSGFGGLTVALECLDLFDGVVRFAGGGGAMAGEPVREMAS